MDITYGVKSSKPTQSVLVHLKTCSSTLVLTKIIKNCKFEYNAPQLLTYTCYADNRTSH